MKDKGMASQINYLVCAYDSLKKDVLEELVELRLFELQSPGSERGSEIDKELGVIIGGCNSVLDDIASTMLSVSNELCNERDLLINEKEKE